MSVKLTFLGGVDQVGGNAVLLEDTGFGVKILLDFGLNIGQYYEHYKRGFSPQSSEELIKFGLLPAPTIPVINNLYRSSIKSAEITDKTSSSNESMESLDGIVISHPHKDHYGGLPYINRAIPVYLGAVTKKIILALAESEKPAVENDFKGIIWKEFRTGENILIKQLLIVPVHVDHSVPASYGFIIYSSQGPLVYTGDFRCHGPLASMTQDFITEMLTHKSFLEFLSSNPRPDYEALHKKTAGKIRLLLCEGTKIHKGQIESEAVVGERITQLLETQVFQFCLVKYDRTDWDRFRTYSEMAKKYGWNFIISERDAYFYYLLNQDERYATMRNPNLLTDDHILIIKDGNALLNWKSLIRSTVYKAKKGDRFLEWSDLLSLDGNFLLYITHLSEELKMVLSKQTWGRGVFISTSIDQYTEEIYDNTQKLSSQLLQWGIPCYQLHASGHANSHELITIVDRIKPEIVIPIHTDVPQMFKKLFSSDHTKVYVQTQGDTFELE